MDFFKQPISKLQENVKEASQKFYQERSRILRELHEQQLTAPEGERRIDPTEDEIQVLYELHQELLEAKLKVIHVKMLDGCNAKKRNSRAMDLVDDLYDNLDKVDAQGHVRIQSF